MLAGNPFPRVIPNARLLFEEDRFAMLLGPVFRAELLRTARRRRYYALRVVYGLLILFIIWAGYEGAIRGKTTITIDEAAEFAEGTFEAFATVQLIAILVMIPALFGGAIADEKQRKTLHYLMASRLSSFEIVVDKVLGRAPHLAVFLALGLPVVCLLGLVGGVDPEYVAIAYVGTTSTATMAVALTVLVSTLARKVRQAVLIAYILLLAWQFLPIFFFGIARIGVFPLTMSWIEPVNAWVGWTSPLYVYVAVMMRGLGGGGPTSWVVVQLAWMVGLQLGVAALFLGLAVWQLRPTFRRHEATQPRRKWFEGKTKARQARPRRWYDRPECGDDAMGWKERHFARTDVFTKMVILPATVLVSVFLVLAVGIDESIPRAFADLWQRGFWGWGAGGEELVKHLRVVSAWYVAIWLLALAGASASSVAVEREEDTWVSLTSTPLTGWEILRGKVLGAIWAQRGFACIPLGLWTIGLVTGSVHPLGFLGTLAAFVATSWMVAAVGIHASLRATSTSKALASTIGKMVVLYGYPFFLLWVILDNYRWGNYYATFVGLPPRLVVAPLVTYGQFAAIRAGVAPPDAEFDDWAGFYRTFGVAMILFYAIIAATLTLRTVRRFDRWLDRPVLSSEDQALRKPAPLAEVAEPALQS
jgi:ABC-type transport system involved in multi-copper enzyme maturation permease subunit